MAGALYALALTLSLDGAPAVAQNVVGDAELGRVVPAIEVPSAELERFVWHVPATPTAEAAGALPAIGLRIARKLERHVLDFLEERRLRPFHCTLGISGYETYFDHPDEMFWALSLSVPWLSPATAARVSEFLKQRLKQAPPYGTRWFDPRSGAPRELYDVPPSVLPRSPGARGRATNAFGVYAFWLFVRHRGGADSLLPHWPAIVERMRPLLERRDGFDIRSRHERDEAEAFCGDLAGGIGFARLARIAGDAELERRALARATEMLARRIDLDRVNARILETTRVRASHSLHNAKLARYIDLVPAVGRALCELTDGVAAARLQEFRRRRNGWYIAFGPRLVGGENYTSPPHLSRAVFDAAAFIEKLPAEELAGFVDIPWCRGDFYFLAKCAYALWALSGSRWENLDR